MTPLVRLTALVCGLVLFDGAGAAEVGAPRADVLPFKATEKTLPNGLKVIVVPTGFRNLVSLQIPVQTGSRNEVEAGKSGFAHFFEHMMFRGTKKFPPERSNAVFARAGASTNAYTTDDYTNYHATFAKQDLEEILAMEADIFQNLEYAEDAFKTESRAVLGEYNKNSADPRYKLFEVLRERAFTTHTYKHTTMGFLRDIEDMPNQFEYSRLFFDRWYRPEYTTLIVTGDVDPDAVMRMVDTYWSHWKRGSHRAAIPAEPARQGRATYVHTPWSSATLPLVTVAFHSPAFSDTDKDFAALMLLLDLEFGSASDLYKRLVEDERKVDQLSLFRPMSADPGVFAIAARLRSGDDAPQVRDEILRVLARSTSTLVNETRVRDARSNARYEFARDLDGTESIASTLARFVRFGRSYDTLNRYYRLIDSLTPQDLRAAAQRHVRDPDLVVATLSNTPLPAATAETPSLASLQAAVPLAGTVATVVQPSALALLEVKLVFAAGSAHDPAGKEGLAALSASMLAEGGSRSLRIDEIKKVMFPIAGRFVAQVDKEVASFTGVVHHDNVDAFLDAVLPMLTDPGLRPDDFARLKEKQKNALVRNLRDNNEEELARERLQANVFAGTPYGHPSLGTVAGIEAIALEDVKAFLARHYTRESLTIGASGDAAEALAARVGAALQALPRGASPATTAPIAGRKAQGIEIEILRKDTRATAISLGFPIEVSRNHPDFAALDVARSWFGEHRSAKSHLYRRMRELRGLNYGDYAYIEAFPGAMFKTLPGTGVPRRAQLFEIWIRPVAPENTQMALRIALHELDALVRDGLTPAQFEETRDYLMKYVFVETATQDQELGYALDAKWYGQGEFTGSMRERLKALGVDDVNRAIRRHLSAQNLSVVIVAKDAAGLREALIADAPTSIQYITPKPEVMDEDSIIGARRLQLRPEAVRITPLDEVFGR